MKYHPSPHHVEYSFLASKNVTIGSTHYLGGTMTLGAVAGVSTANHLFVK